MLTAGLRASKALAPSEAGAKGEVMTLEEAREELFAAIKANEYEKLESIIANIERIGGYQAAKDCVFIINVAYHAGILKQKELAK